MHARTRLVPLLCAALTLLGCDEEPVALTACQEAAQQTPSLQLSSGEEAFELVAEGGYLPAYFGMQGGAHAYVGVRVTGVHPGNALDPLTAPVIQFDAWDGDEHVGTGYSHTQLHESDGAFELYGAMMYVDTGFARSSSDDPPPHETVDVVVSVEDTCGTVIEEKLAVYLGNRWPEAL